MNGESASVMFEEVASVSDSTMRVLLDKTLSDGRSGLLVCANENNDRKIQIFCNPVGVNEIFKPVASNQKCSKESPIRARDKLLNKSFVVDFAAPAIDPEEAERAFLTLEKISEEKPQVYVEKKQKQKWSPGFGAPQRRGRRK